MAQQVYLMGATYNAVPAVMLPDSNNVMHRFDDASVTTATAADVAQGKVFLASDGTITTGTASGSSAITVIETPDSSGGIVKNIVAVDISADTVDAAHVISGYTAHDRYGNAVSGSIASKSSSDLTVSGATVTAPAGYYASSASKSVASGTAGTPTATKGTVSNHSVSVTPSVTNTTGYITGSTKTGTAVTVSASELVSGSQTITENDTYDVTNLASVVVNVSGGSSMNVQVAQSTTRATSSTYTNLVSLTCSTAGTYDIYWSCYRSSTSGTSGSRLYIGGTAYGTENTTFTNHIQNNHLTGVTLAANQSVAVYARSRGSNYYAYVGTLTIVQTA